MCSHPKLYYNGSALQTFHVLLSSCLCIIVNILFFIRLQDIEDLKVAAKKMLRQVVHSIYQALVVKATQVLKEIEVRIYYAIC